jgi:hypothetical protein
MVAVRTDGHFFDGKKVTEKFEGTCVHKSILFEGLRADFCWGTKNAKCEYIIAGKFNILVHERNSRELIIAGIQREVSNLFFQNDGESKCWFDSIPNSNHQN